MQNEHRKSPPRFNTCYILGLLSYLAGCFTDPGGIPDAWLAVAVVAHKKGGVRNESPGIFVVRKWVMSGSLNVSKGHFVQKMDK